MPDKQIEQKLNNGNKVYTDGKLEFVAQTKIRPKILEVLKENFKMEKKWVISEKDPEESK